MKVVTAYGPRCGTSFVMQHCVEAGLPVNGKAFINEHLTPFEGNPNGYFEMISEPNIGMIQKVWPVDLVKIDPKKISALVVLNRRNRSEHLKSIERQAKREGSDYPAILAYEQISQTLHNYIMETGIAHKFVYTEDLNDQIGEILSYLST